MLFKLCVCSKDVLGQSWVLASAYSYQVSAKITSVLNVQSLKLKLRPVLFLSVCPRWDIRLPLAPDREKYFTSISPGQRKAFRHVRMRGQRPEGRRRTKELNGVKEGVGRQAEIYSQRQRWESVIVLSTWTTPSRKTDNAPHTRCGAAVNRQKHKMAEEGGPVWPSNRTMPGAPSGSSSHKHNPKPARAHTHTHTPWPHPSPKWAPYWWGHRSRGQILVMKNRNGEIGTRPQE